MANGTVSLRNRNTNTVELKPNLGRHNEPVLIQISSWNSSQLLMASSFSVSKQSSLDFRTRQIPFLLTRVPLTCQTTATRRLNFATASEYVPSPLSTL